MASIPNFNIFVTSWMKKKINKNAKLEKITNILGIAVCLIVIDPLYKRWKQDNFFDSKTRK